MLTVDSFPLPLCLCFSLCLYLTCRHAESKTPQGEATRDANKSYLTPRSERASSKLFFRLWHRIKWSCMMKQQQTCTDGHKFRQTCMRVACKTVDNIHNRHRCHGRACWCWRLVKVVFCLYLFRSEQSQHKCCRLSGGGQMLWLEWRIFQSMDKITKLRGGWP